MLAGPAALHQHGRMEDQEASLCQAASLQPQGLLEVYPHAHKMQQHEQLIDIQFPA